jgi:hypothetical protein
MLQNRERFYIYWLYNFYYGLYMQIEGVKISWKAENNTDR